MIIAITGATGFVGRALLPLLQAAGYHVLPIGRSGGYNITHWESVRNIGHFDVLIHLAAQSYVPDAYKDPRSFYDTNVTGTLNMLELARLHQSRFIYISSYVYGHPRYMPINEAHEVVAVNPYGQSKIIAEDLCKAYSRDFSLGITIFRPFNIYGIGQQEYFLLPKILRQAAAGGPIELFDPRPKRDYVEVRDVARAIMTGVNHHAAGCDVFNIGSGKSYAIAEVIEMIRPYFPRPLEVTFLNKYRPDEIMDTLCDYSKAEQVLGWRPQISLENGLRDMAEALR